MSRCYLIFCDHEKFSGRHDLYFHSLLQGCKDETKLLEVFFANLASSDTTSIAISFIYTYSNSPDPAQPVTSANISRSDGHIRFYRNFGVSVQGITIYFLAFFGIHFHHISSKKKLPNIQVRIIDKVRVVPLIVFRWDISENFQSGSKKLNGEAIFFSCRDIENAKTNHSSMQECQTFICIIQKKNGNIKCAPIKRPIYLKNGSQLSWLRVCSI